MGRIDSNFPQISHFDPFNPDEFRNQAHQMVDFIADYFQNIESYPILSQVQHGYLWANLPENPPDRPKPFETIMNDVQNKIVPGMTHWLSPNFFALRLSGFLGEMFCNCFNSVGFNWLASPTTTELEMTVMTWLADMLKLPKSFMFQGSGGGVITGIGADSFNKLVVYGSDQTHSTFAKVCKTIGISARNITTLVDEFSLSPFELRTVVEADMAAGLSLFESRDDLRLIRSNR
ncbi:hypothetical protein GQ457_01G001440 [Hibiscus cannabinus]